MVDIIFNDSLKQRMLAIVDECMGESPAFCTATCPLHLDVQGYVGKIADGEYQEALAIIRKDLPFPGILGRICAHPCEDKCKRSEESQPMAIQALKRFAANYDNQKNWDISVPPERIQHIAIIGAGPSGAMAAYTLRKDGYQVTIYEALPVVGGMLRVGIPSYRLPRDVIDFEYSILTKMGITVKLNTKVGVDITFQELQDKYDAVFIAGGAHRSVMVNIPGIDLPGVVPGVDFLRNVSLDRPQAIGKKVVVIGGGNVAIDVARSAVRKGAEQVTLVCLESKDSMPAHSWEVEEAEEEGIHVINNFGLKEFVGQDHLEQIHLIKCTSIFNQEGQFDPQYDQCETQVLESDMVILAIGQSVDNTFLKDNPNLLAANGKVIADPITLQTPDSTVFAGGDIIGRPTIAIQALAHGKKAALSIHRYFTGQDMYLNRDKEDTYESTLIREIKPEEFGTVRRHMKKIDLAKRMSTFDEVEISFTKEEAMFEADRCLHCECKLCMKECLMLADFCDFPKQLMEDTMAACCIDPLIPYSCNMCNQCSIKCPKEYNFSEIFYDMRKELVKQGVGPLPQHKPIHMHQYLGFHPLFNIVKQDVNAGYTKRVFMPGCSLPSYAPEIIGGITRHLQQVLPGTGAVLKCCGKPTKAMGLEKEFKERYKKLEDSFDKLKIEEVIVACQSCYSMVTAMSPHLKVRSLYQVLVEVGIPESAKGIGKGKMMAIHDSCVTRDCSHIHDSVRSLMTQMGYQIEELSNNRENARCCGFGGMVVPANPDLAMRVMQRRADEAKSDYVVTYCAACRESMTKAHKQSFHLMDLMFRPEVVNTGIAPGLQGSMKNWTNRFQSRMQISQSHHK